MRLPHVGVKIRDRISAALRLFTEPFVVGGDHHIVLELLHSGLLEHGRSKNHYLAASRVALVEYRGDVLLVVLERHALVPVLVPDVVDAARKRHHVRLLGKHVAIEPRQHVVGLVAADAGLHRLDVNTLNGERAKDEVDVSVGLLLALLRNRVAKERKRVAVLDDKFTKRRRRSHHDRGNCSNLHLSTFRFEFRTFVRLGFLV